MRLSAQVAMQKSQLLKPILMMRAKNGNQCALPAVKLSINYTITKRAQNYAINVWRGLSLAKWAG